MKPQNSNACRIGEITTPLGRAMAILSGTKTTVRLACTKKAMLAGILSLGTVPASMAAGGSLPPATPVNYHFTTIQILGAQFQNCFLNDNGVASGTFNAADGQQHGFVWQDGQANAVDLVGFPTFALNGLNDHGSIAGCDGYVPLVYNIRYQTPSKLPAIPGMAVAVGGGVNDQGTVVGVAWDANGVNTVGWTWNGRRYSLFTAPWANGPAGGTFAQGINDNGQITGFYVDAGGNAHGFLKNGPAFISFDAPGADETIPVGINNKGDIAGYYLIIGPTFAAHGFVLHNGNFVTVDVPGSPGCGLSAINDQGGISGLYSDEMGNSKAFIAKPQP